MAFVRQLTAKAMGAVAVVEVRGDGAREVVRKVFQHKRVGEVKTGEVLRGRIVSAGGEEVDDGLLVGVGEQVFELHVHGGVAVVEGVMSVLVEAGGKVVEAIASNGLLDEVGAGLSGARTMTAARVLAAQSDAGLQAWANRWRAWDGELWMLQSAVQWLLERSASLRWLLDPPRVAIVGVPNVGKSTLANALLGREAAITSDIAGTTRDWVDGEAVFSADGVEVAVTLVDTAGVRETEDVLEQQSIERTRNQAAVADAVVIVLDGSRAMTTQERQLVGEFEGRPRVVAINKTDMGGALQFKNAVRVSAKRGEGLHALMAAVLDQLDVGRVHVLEPFAFTPRQVELLQRAAVAKTTREATGLLNELVNSSSHG